jgi:spoIIIJ-associated protein
MSEYQEFTGKTVEEALRNARESFGVSGLDDLDFEILTPGSRGVLGMGAEPARIVAAPRAALGGAAPRREAAASVPLPAPPPREDRGRGPGGGGFRDRGPRDRGAPGGRGGYRDRDRDRGGDRGGERDGRRSGGRGGEREGTPTERRPVGPGGAGGRDFGRPPGEAPRAPRPERAGGGLSETEQAQVQAAARAATAVEGEEVQAAEASPEALAAAKDILETLLRHMGYQATVEVLAGETSKLDVRGDESEKEALGALIGRKGERLSALQHVVNLMLSRRMGEWTRVLVDVEDYRGRRERQLREIAQRAAARVVETGKMLQLEPMPALERRWIHLALRENDQVTTQSIGEEPNRRVVVLRREG